MPPGAGPAPTGPRGEAGWRTDRAGPTRDARGRDRPGKSGLGVDPDRSGEAGRSADRSDRCRRGDGSQEMVLTRLPT